MSVVCAVDGSPETPGLARYAADVAARAGTELWLVRAVQVQDPLFVPAAPYRIPRDPGEQREKVLEHTRRQLDELSAELEGVQARTEVRQGPAADQVLEAAAEHGARLLVVASRTRTGLGGAVGTVSQRVIRRARCPVVAVPPGYDRRLGERVVLLVGIRGGDREDAATVAAEARKLARMLGAELALAHVERRPAARAPRADSAETPEPGAPARSGRPEAAAEQRSEASAPAWLHEISDGARSAVLRGDPARELLLLAAEIDADAVVVAPRGRGPLRQALLGSVSGGLLAAGERPVIVIPREHPPPRPPRRM